ncbi:TIGR04076 family protein [Gracilibacillus massiliensis]|uniref:TIGR04076 family protein n=1 Tax=Gracilibacillus massiliensis TaxID=1564956 RepID=UPI00071C6D8D|nr:TIGR04076 family protein [Gracilibacillus massiliensis]
MDDKFTLYNLKVEVIATDKPMVCNHKEGSYFLVEGEDIIFPEHNAFSMYALSAILPLIPAKQRVLHKNDWMLSDSLIACPDPNCGARFKITRTETKEFSHADCTIEPIHKGDTENGREI